VPVLGTNEHHPELGTFRYIGMVALKLLFELELEVVGSRVVVLGSGEFAGVVASALVSAGAVVQVVAPSELATGDAAALLANADGLVVVEHHDRRALLGRGGLLPVSELTTAAPALCVAHICGAVERDALVEAGLRCVPARFAPAGHMSVATDYLGPRPLIDLHAAGLVVGADLARAMLRGLSAYDAEVSVLRTCAFAQGFPGHHPAPQP
jgi:hypothetical protein